MSSDDPTTEVARPFDLERIAEVIARHEVVCVLVGGASGTLYGMTDYVTKDADFLIRSDRRNRERLTAALRELGVGDVTPDDLTGNTQWETNAGPVDILVEATGLNETVIVYSDIAYRSEVFEIGDNGVTVTAVALDDLIRMKEAANRYKDHLALPELRRIRGDAHPERMTPVDPFHFDIEYGIDDRD